MNITTVDAVPDEKQSARLNPANAKTIQEIVETWEQSFQQLKSLRLEVSVNTIVDSGVAINPRLLYRGRFVYDAPNYYCEVVPAAKDGGLGEPTILAFDGQYYYLSSKGGGAGQALLTRSTQVPSEPAYYALIASVNPLLRQFSFVFNLNDIKTIEALKKTETWNSLSRRIEQVRKSTDGNKDHMIFRSQSWNQEGAVQDVYEVHVEARNPFFPKSWEMTTTQQKELIYGMVVSSTKKYQTDTVNLSFPLRFNDSIHRQGKLLYSYESVISPESLHVNVPVDPLIFTIKPDENTKFVDKDKFEGGQ